MRSFGYLVSIVSVMLLGMVAWPKPEDPAWHRPVLVAGMAASIIGMGLRWLASRKQRAELLRLKERTDPR